MPRMNSNCGFTLIELLVVIAIIAILSAALMPAVSSSLDRSRVNQCHSNLTHVAIGLRMCYNDQGGYPPTLSALLEAGFITDDSLLCCTKTGAQYYYHPPLPDDSVDTVVVACVDPATPSGQRPHSFRHSFLVLHKGGKIVEVGR